MVFKNHRFCCRRVTWTIPIRSSSRSPLSRGGSLEEINGGLSYYKFKDRCIFCDIIAQEKER